MNTDPIADYLTRIRNASLAKKKIVEIPGSNVKRAMTQIRVEIQRFNETTCNYKIATHIKPWFEKVYQCLRYATCIEWSWNSYRVNIKRCCHRQTSTKRKRRRRSSLLRVLKLIISRVKCQG